jgi:hypothetical protein
MITSSYVFFFFGHKVEKMDFYLRIYPGNCMGKTGAQMQTNLIQ